MLKLRFLILIFLLNFSDQAFSQSGEFALEVEKTFERLTRYADTDEDKKITIEDSLPENFMLKTIHGDSIKINNTYSLSILLQELALAQGKGRDSLFISLAELKEPPSERISRRIREYFWDDLTRSIDRKGIAKILKDEKAEGEVQRLYVPASDSAGIAYFSDLQEELKGFQLLVLPKEITPEYVKSINDKPGLLSLALKDGKGVPFVVPGGRFNEMYGWDSYFIGVGLLIDGRVNLAKAMIDNFVYQINHYGKILNANRTYYLTRTQPPFMSSFVREVYEEMGEKNISWLRKALSAAIKEYEQVWMEEGKRLTSNGLNRYHAQGIGIPPETEAGHFEEVLQKYADNYGMSVADFRRAYQNGRIENTALDQYFIHDRSQRESGHDTTWRLVNRASWLNPVGLNSLLYKYEKDFEALIDNYFNGKFTTASGKTYASQYWKEKAAQRKKLMNRYLWNEQEGSFFDYNFKEGKQTGYISATNFYPLWSGMASKDQAKTMVKNLMDNLKVRGGILASAKVSVEKTATSDVQRQWDYPFGWAPHQMLLWKGLLNYGFEKQAQELIYRWLWMITRNAVDYNGTIPEKYNVVKATHKVYAEYGNVGTEFDYITTSGFGWMNASYQYGLSLLDAHLVRKLNLLVPPSEIF